MSLPGLLRAALLVLLAASLLLPEGGGAPPAGYVARLSGPPATWDAGLWTGAPLALAVRSAEAPPGADEMEALAGVAERAPLLARLPERTALLEVSAPRRPTAGRAAALPVRVRGLPGDTLLLRLEDALGELDSLRLVLGPGGAGEAAFRLRPRRAGWAEWTVRGGGREARTGAWVSPARPPRVLVAAGAPGWESRFVVRALEESGAAVELVQPLGRGLSVRQGPPAVPADAGALGRFDAVLVLEGAELDAPRRRALAAYAARGGGVLAVGSALRGVDLQLAAADGESAEVAGDAIRWTLPAELAPLPAAEGVRSSLTPLGRLRAGAREAASSPAGGVLALRPLGRGRAAALGVTESWRWRMEAGRVEEHREFWRSLVDWLASAPRDSVLVEVAAPVAPVGAPAAVRVFAPGDAAPRLLLRRPEGGGEPLSLARDPAFPGSWRGVFVPARPGVYTLGAEDGAPRAALRVVAEEAPAADPWARLALLAAASGGEAVPADSFDAVLARRAAGTEGEPTGGVPLRALLFALVVGLGAVEWGVRRVRGRG